MGIATGAAVLQTQLWEQLPPDTIGGWPTVYDPIPDLRNFEPDLQSNARNAYATGLKALWFVLVGIAVLGLIISFIMGGVKLRKAEDGSWTWQGHADALDEEHLENELSANAVSQKEGSSA